MKKHANPGGMIYRDKDPVPGEKLRNIYCGMAVTPPSIGTLCNVRNAKTDWKGEGIVTDRNIRLNTYTLRVVVI